MVEHNGRNETPHERLDRLWVDQLQELRVMQTGVQLLAGFLLTLPFQPTFDELDGVQRGIFLGLMIDGRADHAVRSSPRSRSTGG